MKGETRVVVCRWSALEEASPSRVRLLGVDLVVVRLGASAHVLSSRCPHRGASLADGTLEGKWLLCAEHGWDFSCETGESRTLAGECVRRFESWIDERRDRVLVLPSELRHFSREQEGELDYSL